jgi:hypothetical protein
MTLRKISVVLSLVFMGTMAMAQEKAPSKSLVIKIDNQDGTEPTTLEVPPEIIDGVKEALKSPEVKEMLPQILPPGTTLPPQLTTPDTASPNSQAGKKPSPLSGIVSMFKRFSGGASNSQEVPEITPDNINKHAASTKQSFKKWWSDFTPVKNIKWWFQPGNAWDGYDELVSISSLTSLKDSHDLAQTVKNISYALKQNALNAAETEELVRATQKAEHVINGRPEEFVSEKLKKKLRLQEGLTQSLAEIQQATSDIFVQAAILDALKVLAVSLTITYIAETKVGLSIGKTLQQVRYLRWFASVAYGFRRFQGNTDDLQTIFFVVGMPTTFFWYAILDPNSKQNIAWLARWI